MAYFRDDNTSGYDQDDLDILNDAWESLGVSAMDPSEIDSKSIMDHVAERLLADFDRGLRGDALVAYYYSMDNT